MSLATRIARLRKRAGINRAELQRRTQLTYMTLWRLETGAEHNPTIDTLYRLANALGADICELLSPPHSPPRGSSIQ